MMNVGFRPYAPVRNNFTQKNFTQVNFGREASSNSYYKKAQVAKKNGDMDAYEFYMGEYLRRLAEENSDR